MSKKIAVEASELWSYFQKNKDELISSMREIASNDEFGIVIYLSAESEEFAHIIVEADDTEVYTETVISEGDCKYAAERIYNTYLSGSVVNVLTDGNITDGRSWTQIEDEEIENREYEIDDALYAFLGAVCDDVYYEDYYIDEELIQDVKEHFLEYLARKWGLPIRRPMRMEDEDGEIFFEEYPYQYMIFDDENDPVYK